MRAWTIVLCLTMGLATNAAAQEARPYTFRWIAGGDTVVSDVVTPTTTGMRSDLTLKPTRERFRSDVEVGPHQRVRAITTDYYRSPMRDTVPVFAVMRGVAANAVVTWSSADSAVVALPPHLEVHVTVSPKGDLLGGTIPALNARVVRLSGAHPLAGGVDDGHHRAAPQASRDSPVRSVLARLTRPGSSRTWRSSR